MANVIENVITARDEATPKLQAVRAEIGRVTSSLNGIPSRPAPGLVPHLQLIRGQLSGVASAVSQLAPQASGALAPMQSLLSLSSASLGPIGLGVTGIAVTLGALALAAKKATEEVAALGEQAENIYNLSQSAGVSVANIQGLQVALENAGIPSEALTVSFRQLNRAIADQDPALKKLGITTTDTFAAFLQLSDLFQRSADGPNKTAAAVALLGRSGEQLIPVMNQGAGAMREMIEQARAMGLTFSDQTVRALVAVDDQFDELQNRVRGLKNELVLLAAPAVSEVVRQMNDLLATVRGIPQTFSDAGLAMKLMAEESVPGLKRLNEAVAPIAAVIKAIKELTSARETLLRTGTITGASQNVPTAAESGVKPTVPNTKPPAEETEREKMLKRLHDLLGLTREQARLAYEDLKRLDDTAAALSLQEKLNRARGLPVDALKKAAELPFELPKPRRDPMRELDRQAREGLNEAVHAKAASETPDFGDVARAFKETLDHMMEDATRATDFIYGSFEAIQGSLTTVFQGIFADLSGIPGQVMTLAKAVNSIITSMVNQALAQLARLAAAKLFTFLIKLLGGGLPNAALQAASLIPYGTPELRRSSGGLVRGPGTSTSDSIPARLSAGEFVVRASSVRRPGILSHLESINLGTLAMAGFSAPASTVSRETSPSAGLWARERSVGNTYVIQAINARDAVLSLTQPGGGLRSANDRLDLEAAY